MTDKDGLYETYHPKVYAYMLASVKNQHTAEDLCSEVFVKIFDKLENYDDKKASLSTWIYNISKNTLYDYYRTNRPLYELNEEMPDDCEDLDESSTHEDELKSLAGALMQLDEIQRKIITYKYYKGKTLKAIAAELGISHFLAWSIHKKSLEKIKKIMLSEQIHAK